MLYDLLSTENSTNWSTFDDGGGLHFMSGLDFEDFRHWHPYSWTAVVLPEEATVLTLDSTGIYFP